MDIKIQPGRLSGKINIPTAKAAAHRAIICAILSKGTCTISNVDEIDDISTTISAARSLGANIDFTNGILTIKGISSPPESATVNCLESGSTLRFFVPVAAALGINATFLGEARLPMRPMTPLTDVLTAHGITITKSDNANEIFTISGKLACGRFELPGNISSQYITGLLFALPLLDGDSEIILTTPLESRGYVDMTLNALANAGIEITVKENGYFIKGGQQYNSKNSAAEGDYSSGAFWLCAGAVNSQISVSGLDPNSVQGDKAVISILKKFGADVKIDSDCVTVSSNKLSAVDIDVSDIPDLLPILAVVAAFANGTSCLYNAARLRLKESDRLATVTAGLKALGADIEEHSDKLVITGKKTLGGGTVESFVDHRIAMCMSIAALGCTGETVIKGAECVSKSYPQFYKHLKDLGGICNVINLG